MDPLIADLVALRSRFGRLADQTEWEWEQLARRQLAVQPIELLAVLLDLLDAGVYRPHPRSEEQELLLRDAVLATGGEGWQKMMERLETESWEVRVAAGRWLGGAAEVHTVRTWIAGNIERARLVASVATSGGEQLDPVARFLINTFGSDKQVSESLRSALIPNTWRDSEADRYEHLIHRVTTEWLETKRDVASKPNADPNR